MPLTLIDPKTLIDDYRDVEDGSRRMLAAAHAGDWQQVALVENDCKRLIERLKRQAHAGGREPVFAPQERQEKQRILLRILSVDAQIRCLLDPWRKGAHTHSGANVAADPQDHPKVLH